MLSVHSSIRASYTYACKAGHSGDGGICISHLITELKIHHLYSLITTRDEFGNELSKMRPCSQ